jgi:hypothetical protein
VEQVAVGRVQFDAVQAGFDGRACGMGELLGDGSDLRRLQRARYGVWPGAAGGDHLAGCGDGTGGDGLVTVLVVGVGHASGVHELGDAPSAWTAPATARHPATCRAVYRPGVFR